MSNKENLSFRESLRLIGFSFKTAHKLMPIFFPLVLVRSLVTSAQPLLMLFFSARILNELNGSRDVRMIIIYVSVTVGLTFLLSVLKALFVRTVETHTGFEQAMRRIDMTVAERFATMDFAYTEDSGVSEILSRMDIMAKSSARGLVYVFLSTPHIADSVFSLIFAFLLLAGPFSVDGVGQASQWGFFALYGLFAIGLLVGLWLRSKEAPLLQKRFAKAANTNALADYYFEFVKAEKAAKDVRLYAQSELLGDIFSKAFSAKPWISFFSSMGHIDGFSLGMMAAVGGGFYLLVGYNALGGAVQVGSIVQMVGAATALTGAIGSLIGQIGELYNNASFLKPMLEYLGLPDILVKGKKSLPEQPDAGYTFEFRNVSFKYPSTEHFALQNVNLKLFPGERLAIVGLNGSGKTTFVKLLCRLYDPVEGEILLEGVEIKKFNYARYIALFSVVFQDYKLFPLPLSQNIAADECYNAERVLETLDGAGFTKRLNTMKNGLDTILYKDYDEDGTTISGGEAQKIALARALYKNTPVIVLDEPTAALDPIAEYEVYTTFDRTIGKKTAVFISHRLSSCRFCHRVAVFEKGRLAQLGTHEDLLADAGGRYAELWEAQAQYYT